MHPASPCPSRSAMVPRHHSQNLRHRCRIQSCRCYYARLFSYEMLRRLPTARARPAQRTQLRCVSSWVQATSSLRHVAEWKCVVYLMHERFSEEVGEHPDTTRSNREVRNELFVIRVEVVPPSASLYVAASFRNIFGPRNQRRTVLPCVLKHNPADHGWFI